MPILITVRDSAGKILGTCDERCYLSQHKQCQCICGGKCHGIGLQAAARAALALVDIDDTGFSRKVPVFETTIQKPRALHDWAHPRLFDDT